MFMEVDEEEDDMVGLWLDFFVKIELNELIIFLKKFIFNKIKILV